MGFGEAVSTLLQTYTNCLSLLKAFERGASGYDVDDQQSLLRRSIRTDRKKVQRAYTSRLSQCGSRLEKGDKPAKSSLRRILRRLTEAIRRLLHMASSTPAPILDYDSLLSLSSSSRIDAIRAMDQLSHRLNSSRSSFASSKPTDKRRRDSSTSSSASRQSDRRKNEPRSKKRRSSPAQSNDRAEAHKKHVKQQSVPTTSGGRISVSPSDRSRTLAAEQSVSSRTAVGSRNRTSLYSIATDSTKLGEIPERKLRRRQTHDSALDEYGAQVAYPIRPYTATVVKEQRKGWAFWRR